MRKRQREKGCRSIIDKDDILSGWWENEWISTRWIAWSHHAVLWRMNWEQRLLPVLRAHFFFLSLHFRLSQNILQTFFIHEHWIFTDKNFAKNMFVKKKKRKNEGKKKISSLSSTVQQTSYEWNILFNWKCILHSSRCFEPIPQRYFGVLCKVL